MTPNKEARIQLERAIRSFERAAFGCGFESHRLDIPHYEHPIYGQLQAARSDIRLAIEAFVESRVDAARREVVLSVDGSDDRDDEYYDHEDDEEWPARGRSDTAAPALCTPVDPPHPVVETPVAQEGQPSVPPVVFSPIERRLLRLILEYYNSVRDIEATESQATRTELIELFAEMAITAAHVTGSAPPEDMPGLQGYYDVLRRRWVSS